MLRCCLLCVLVGLGGCGRVDSTTPTSCSAPLAQCGADCANLQSDHEHCGSCTTACAAAEVCSAGACESSCQAPLSSCGGSCVNLASDAVHCGMCDNACPASQSCVAGTCVSYGTGRDGDVSLISAVDINVDSLGASNDANGAFADGVAFKVVTNPTASSIIVAGSVTGAIVAGDRLLLINLQGTADDASSVGTYEVVEVASAADSEIHIARPIVRSYSGMNFANQKVVVQRIPSYSSVAESGGGRITASAWDGLAGADTGQPVSTGIVAMSVTGTLSIAGSGIDVSNKGFVAGSPGSMGPKTRRART